ncbi:RAS GTPASE-ACTIVATING PROTEIN-BINDING PROTEIN [Salix purpurea]|uniref:RAS GTPASE-ACTIVATING PROTEIN-BINDING PROTEIN n=1 Tax=Salix purpurea TaxID=77065 RepID=A0A9Q0UAS5_SALPP|nr:RAS GTPASE-ACTIVATING PROTEIN-BINDING PROTEIN [Salix purpurea]
MATQVDDSTNKPDPIVVGNAFAEQYYNTLSMSPELLHNFYNDSSLIGRPGLDGSVSSTSTLEEIKKTILSLDYKNCAVEIQTVDSQESYENAVMVLVTGFFAGKDFDRKKFTQAFFLVPQDNGRRYFVLNDVFRYVEESENKKISDADNIASPTPVTPSPEPASVPNHTVAVNVSTNLEEGGVQANESGHPLDISETVASSVQEDAPKKSYASVVHALNLKTQPFQRVSGVKPVKQSVTAVPPVASQQTGSPRPPGNNAVEINNKSAAVEGHSIFVANLPMDATVDELVQTFSKFGAIKPNGVQVRSYKQDKNCFGFVEFESADSVEKALEVSTVSIGTRTAHIEKKNAKTDGEKYPVRKGGFRNDSFRNRGNFGGGRGNGRNDFESQGGVSGQAWGTTGRNGEANKKVYQNGGGRGPRQAQAGRN